MLTENVKEQLVLQLKGLINDLVEGEISKIVSSGRSLMSIEEIMEELNYYPGTMTLPPDSTYENWEDEIDIYEVAFEPPPSYQGEIVLYYDNEQSDLWLKFDVIQEQNETTFVKIRGLDVM
ncbi:hypothetical protein ACIQZI_13825 [Peribacillus sp. NPDC096379]|uniref:DUF7668 domain-containing protein n=1 Tax=Peribacillus sp. NPDC096379 TaxID=3364393 RepID=UPI003827B097